MSPDRLNDSQMVTILAAVNEAMVNKVSEPMFEVKDSCIVTMMSVRKVIEDARRAALLGFSQGLFIGSRADDGSIVKAEEVLNAQVKRESSSAVPLDTLPERFMFVGTDRYLYGMYALKGLKIGRGIDPLELRVPLGGPEIDFGLLEIRKPVGVNGGQANG